MLVSRFSLTPTDIIEIFCEMNMSRLLNLSLVKELKLTEAAVRYVSVCSVMRRRDGKSGRVVNA